MKMKKHRRKKLLLFIHYVLVLFLIQIDGLFQKMNATNPDKNMMNGRLQGISAFPETFFVDKNGNIVGETYSGSHTLEEWKEIVEKELSAIKENN